MVSKLDTTAAVKSFPGAIETYHSVGQLCQVPTIALRVTMASCVFKELWEHSMLRQWKQEVLDVATLGG